MAKKPTKPTDAIPTDSTPKPKHPGGRPTKYDPSRNPEVTAYCLLGATNEELARFLGVCTSTVELWQRTEPEFSGALKEGKELADSRVTTALYEKAKAGDTTAMIFWLKNRRKQHWRDKHDVEFPDLSKALVALPEAVRAEVINQLKGKLKK